MRYQKSVPGRSKTSRAFTLPEMVIAVAVFSLIMTAILSLQVITARTLKDLHLPTLSRSARMIALNQIRYRLADARIGSCVVSDNDTRIRFVDPNLGGVTSEFYFEPPDATSSNRRQQTQGLLYYDNDIDDGTDARVVAVGPVIINFRLGRETSTGVFENQESLVTLYVKTSTDLGYSRVDERDGEIVVYLRNPEE